eukprot:53863-Amphidinium_carterae.1
MFDEGVSGPLSGRIYPCLAYECDASFPTQQEELDHLTQMGVLSKHILGALTGIANRARPLQRGQKTCSRVTFPLTQVERTTRECKTYHGGAICTAGEPSMPVTPRPLVVTKPSLALTLRE